MLATIDLRGRAAADGAGLDYRTVVPRAAVDVEAALSVVRPICDDVAARGEAALREYSERFDRVVYFLSRVVSCVAGNLCDRGVADEFFLDYARSFWRFFSDSIAKERGRGAPNFAIAIENYLKEPR